MKSINFEITNFFKHPIIPAGKFTIEVTKRSMAISPAYTEGIQRKCRRKTPFDPDIIIFKLIILNNIAASMTMPYNNKLSS